MVVERKGSALFLVVLVIHVKEVVTGDVVVVERKGSALVVVVMVIHV